MKNNLIKIIATGLYSGYGRPFPGTWGTLPALFIALFFIQGNQVTAVTLAIITLFLSIWAAGKAELIFGHDAKVIVIDEWAGMFVSILFIPYTITNYIIAFILFRLFDVIKLFPARQAEKLPGGWGITMDDIAAGIQTNIAVHLILILMNWIK
ncbi:MAG: phosphatidylglycerophosphatase A [candidate division Zixibacteria bacterium]|nr:phosphatidylglycerophosphatase A [candidate division Zixibacteria bacterium]